MSIGDKIKKNIQKYDYDTILIPDDNYLPAFGYTIGLFETHKHPEIIAVGLHHETIKAVIDNVCYKIIEQGECFGVNNSYSGIIKNYDVQFVEVDKAFI